jgi:subtilisin family serine protease
MTGALTAFLSDAANAGGPGATPASSPAPSDSGSSGLASSDAQWPLELLDAAGLWQHTRGAGVKIAVVDTGVDSGSPDLRKVVIESRDLLGGHTARVSSDSHGTEVAELIAGSGQAGPAGLAPAVSVISIRVAASLPTLTAGAIAAGIAAAADAGAQVINVSVGVRQDTAALRSAVSAAQRRGCLVVASAGGQGTALYPASIAGVLSVGAEDQQRKRAMAPPGTALFAPGTGLFPNAQVSGVSALSGSDYAAAYVSAAAALLLSASPKLTPTAAGSDLTAVAGASKLLDARTALQLASRPVPTQTSSPTPARQSSPSPARPVPGGKPILAYLFIVLAAVVLLFTAYLIFLARRTRRSAVRMSGADVSEPPGADRVLQPPGYEPFPWDQPW